MSIVFTDVDLFWENGFLRAISPRRRGLRYDEKTITSKTSFNDTMLLIMKSKFKQFPQNQQSDQSPLTSTR